MVFERESQNSKKLELKSRRKIKGIEKRVDFVLKRQEMSLRNPELKEKRAEEDPSSVKDFREKPGRLESSHNPNGQEKKGELPAEKQEASLRKEDLDDSNQRQRILKKIHFQLGVFIRSFRLNVPLNQVIPVSFSLKTSKLLLESFK